MFTLIALGIAGAIASTVSTISSLSSAHAALEQQSQMMKAQELENSYKDLTAKNQTLDQMHQALQVNEAHQAVSGLAFNSPSFIATNAETIRQGDQALQNADTATALNDYKIKLANSARQGQLHAQELQSIVGGFSTLTQQGLGFASNYNALFGQTANRVRASGAF